MVWTSLTMWRSDLAPSFPPRCWLPKLSMWAGQFHYYLWVPSSGLLSTTTVKSVKNSIQKSTQCQVSIYTLFSLQLIHSKPKGIFYVFILVNDEFSVPFKNTSLHIRISVWFEILWNISHLFDILRRDYSFSFWQRLLVLFKKKWLTWLFPIHLPVSFWIFLLISLNLQPISSDKTSEKVSFW